MAQNTNALRLAGNRPTDYKGGLSAGSRDPYKRLAAAILANAAKAAKKGDLSAAGWLLSEHAAFLAGAIGLSVTHVERWARDRLV